MNEKLQSIFVPETVAILAKDKGFDEWCACVKSDVFGFLACSYHDAKWNFDFTSCLPIPTHFQLIKWLKDKYDIDVQMQHNGLWDVQNKEGEYVDLGLEINEALELALKQVKC